MDKIPITFDKFTGYFTKVSGAGESSIWHLYDSKNYYIGRLRFTDKWVFDSSPKGKEFETLADYFGEVVRAWYQ